MFDDGIFQIINKNFIPEFHSPQARIILNREDQPVGPHHKHLRRTFVNYHIASYTLSCHGTTQNPKKITKIIKTSIIKNIFF